MANMRIPFTIKPDTDAGASHYAKFGVGGYYSVKDISERNSIPKVRLEPGLVVYVKTTHETWQYLGDPDGWSRILIPNLSEWTDLSERVKFLEDERVWVEESPYESASDFLSEFAGETIYTASEIDEMMARKAEVVDNYYIVAPSCVHYGISSIRVLVYQRNAEFGTYLISQDSLGPMGLQISYKIYDESDTLLNTISVTTIEDGGFNISSGNIPKAGRIVITLGVHSPRDYSVVDIYDSHEICVVTSIESIPSTLSDLTEDSEHRVVTDVEKRTWNKKQNALISGSNIKTINGESILGSGNLTIEGGGSDYINVIESITFNGSSVAVDNNKNAAITYTAPVTSVNGNTGEVTINVPTKVSDLNNDSGFIITETDPIFSASTAASITSSDITKWDGKQDALVTGTSINIQTNTVSKNLWNPTNSTNSSPGFSATSRTVGTDGIITITNNSGNSASRITEEHTAAELGLENGKVYTLTFYCDSMSTDTNRKNLLWVNGNYEQLNPESGTDYITVTWTQTNNSKVQVGTIYFDDPVNGQTKSYKIQLEQGNVRTNYVAYNVGLQVPVISAIIPEQVNSDWNASSGAAQILNKPTIPTVPTTLSSFTDDLGSSPTHTHSQYLTEHQDISNYIQKSNTSGLVKNDGTIDTSVYLTQHQDISNYIQKSNTSGLVKNDGTIDTNDYLVDEDVFEDINANGHDYVDLGLPSGTLWATMNVGASTISDYGNYYMWGITTPYDETDTLYNGTEHYLGSTNDVASLEWGGTWHTPTVEQLTELVQYTTYERGSDGTSKYIHKYDSTKYIIIPHAGLYSTSQPASSDPSSSGINNGNAWLWSNTGYPEDSSGTVKYSLSIGSLCAVLPKSYGISIRPVLDNKRVKNQTSSNYVKPSWNQTLTSAPDYIVGKPSFSSLNSIGSGASPILCSSSTSWFYDTTGIKYSSSNGTTSALGNATLTLGNVTASGTTGNKFGKLSLYDTGTHTVALVSSVLSTNRTLNLPNEDGTLATQSYVTSHLPATMIASGSNHAGGLVPDPGSTQGTTKYLREDGTWQVPTNTTYSATDFDIKDLTDSTSLRSTWSGKQDALVSGTNIKTINNQSLLGSGNITISGGGGGGGSVDTITNNEIDSIWDRIINGIISFTIDDVSYQAGVNMTWAAWVESDYNTGDFYVNESNEIFTTGSQQVVGVVDTDVIEENGSYTLTTIFD